MQSVRNKLYTQIKFIYRESISTSNGFWHIWENEHSSLSSKIISIIISFFFLNFTKTFLNFLSKFMFFFFTFMTHIYKIIVKEVKKWNKILFKLYHETNLLSSAKLLNVFTILLLFFLKKVNQKYLYFHLERTLNKLLQN